MGKFLRGFLAWVAVLGSLLGMSPPFASAETLADPIALQATVAIGYWFEIQNVGWTEKQVFTIGSGSIISPDGLILTNYHVAKPDFKEVTDEMEAFEALIGGNRKFRIADTHPVILIPDDHGVTEAQYMANLASSDQTLDLAVLRIMFSAYGDKIDPTALKLPFLPIGDSDRMRFGEPLGVYGYPGIGWSTLTFSQGVVSGFEYDWDIGSIAWVKTDAAISGGSSGGAALDGSGAIVGVLTRASDLDCRPGDTNYDGQTDELDGCIPLGDSLGFLRPIVLAIPLIERATSAPTVVPSATPRPTDTPTLFPTMSCLSPRFNAGEAVNLADNTWLRKLPSRGSAGVEFLYSSAATLVILEPVVQSGDCQWYRVRAIPSLNEGYVIEDVLGQTVSNRETELPSGDVCSEPTLMAGDEARLARNTWLHSEPFQGGPGIRFLRKSGVVVRILESYDETDECGWYLVEVLPSGDLGFLHEKSLQTINARSGAGSDMSTLIDLLPTDEMMPEGLVQISTGGRSLAEVVGMLGGAQAVESLLRNWGWEGSAFRDFYTAEGTTTPNGTYVMNVSVHRFLDEESASNALIYFSDYFIRQVGAKEITGKVIGDESRLFVSRFAGEAQAFLYMRIGNVMYRVGANASGASPTVDVLAVGRAITER